jgi:hypothetical protein
MSLILLGFLIKKIKENKENPAQTNFSIGIYRLAQKLRIL